MSYPHPIENIMRSTMEEIRQMVDVSTIVGDPIISGSTMILPVSKVSLGFVSGGGEYSKGEAVVERKDGGEFTNDVRHPFAGTSAAGMSVTPMAFLVINDGSVKVIPAEYSNTIDRLIEMVPRAAEEIKKVLGSFFGNKEDYEDDEDGYSCDCGFEAGCDYANEYRGNPDIQADPIP